MTEIKRKLYKKKKCNFVAFLDLPTTAAASEESDSLHSSGYLSVPPQTGDAFD